MLLMIEKPRPTPAERGFHALLSRAVRAVPTVLDRIVMGPFRALEDRRLLAALATMSDRDLRGHRPRPRRGPGRRGDRPMPAATRTTVPRHAARAAVDGTRAASGRRRPRCGPHRCGARRPERRRPCGTILTEKRAAGFARIALGHVEREYPNKLDHVMDRTRRRRGTPRALHPVFFGSFDWHSCVHGYWLLARLLRPLPRHGARRARSAPCSTAA